MPFRRSFRRPAAVRRPHRWEWVHDTFNNVAPAALNNDDLLANFKAQFAISANFPDLVIYRTHIRFMARFNVTTFASNDGVLCTMFVDSTKQTLVNQATNSNDEHYLIYTQLYNGEQIFNGSPSLPPNGEWVCFHEWDVKSRRRMVNINDSLFFQTAATGAVALVDYSISFACLLKLP
jgi:hypothetical protein